MENQEQNCNRLSGIDLRMTVAVMTVLVLTAITPTAQSQTLTVLHYFTGAADGAYPGELAIDRVGNLYGSATGGNGGINCPNNGCGVVFKLKHSGNSWTFAPLYSFQAKSDGAVPQPVVFGADGSLYGVSELGGSCPSSSYGCGMVFKLTPPPSACKTAICPWIKTDLYDFAGGNDGVLPVGPVAFGQDGSIYGVTSRGGAYNYGIVYKLTPSNGSWTESVLHTFKYGDGIYPSEGVVLDQAGNLYGVADYAGFGGEGSGTIFELSPSGSGWQFSVIHYFLPTDDGTFPVGGLIFDQAGNLYGTTTSGPGSNGAGTVFMLTPTNGSWTETLLNTFTGTYGGGPYGRLNRDATGALYGTTLENGAYGFGNIFSLSPSNGGWAYTNLHSFTYNNDGAYPISNLVFDSQGNFYGTATSGGSNQNCSGGCGVVFEITP